MRCRICGGEQGSSEYVAKEMMFGLRDSFDYFQCGTCGCLQIASFPVDMSRYYPTSYYSLGRNEPRRAPRRGVRGWAEDRRDEFAALHRGLVGRLLYRIHPNEDLRKAVAERFPGGGVSLARLRTDSRILDVGCGTGGFLMTLFEAGFRNLQGVDPYVDGNIEYSGGWRVLKGTIADCKGTWDVIMFHHSFEHVRDPVETLSAAVDLLADQGTIVVRIPVVSSYAWERYGVAWVQLDAPRHFFLHSRQSMTRLAETVGLRLARVAYDSTEFQFLGSEQYLRDIPLMAKGSSALSGGESIFSAEEVQEYCRLAKELNASERGDQAAFYLKKL